MLNSFRNIIVPGAFLILSGCLSNQEKEPLPSMLEERIPGLMKEAHVPGLSMVLIMDNRIVWKGTFGVRAAGKPEKVDDKTIFEAASMSKPLYTYAVLKLAENKRFYLDRPLDSYLSEPYLPGQDRAKKITPRMVMLHRTGLPNWRKGGWRSGEPLKVLNEPGTAFTYSGEGYLYLQTAIEQLTKKPLAPWMDENLLIPLKMTQSSYIWRTSFKTNFAGGHDRNGNFKKGRRFYKRANAAYSLYTTPTDYAKFLLEIIKKDRSAKHSLGNETIQKMTTLQVTPDKDNNRTRRSLGWIVGAEEAGGWVSHSGSNGSGFRCHSRFNMTTGSGSVIMTNSLSGNSVWGEILKIIDKDLEGQSDL